MSYEVCTDRGALLRHGGARWTPILFALIAVLLASAQRAGAQESARPNVLILLSDDQQPGALSAFGAPELRTPNLDRLARGGFAFRNAYCMGSMSGAVCKPSRAMLLSGRSLFRAPGNLEGVVNMPEHFRRAGYQTFGTGKWHNGKASFARGFERGRNVFFGGMSNHFRVPIVHLRPDGSFTAKATGARHSSELFADAAIEFLERRDPERPFFAYVSFTAPHDPRTPPPAYKALYDPDEISLPENYLPVHPFDNGEMVIRDEKLAPWPRTPEVVREHLAAYYGMITHMDAQIGRILDALQRSGGLDRTLIVFASDHGLAVGRHGLLGKQNLYEHSARAPMVLHGPGIPQGRSQALCYLLDIFPTLCDLVQLPPPDGLEGRTLAGIARGERVAERDALFLAYKDGQRAIRTPRWKLIRYPLIHRTQLFDLESDPLEQHDLSGAPEQASRAKELMGRLRSLQVEVADPHPLTAKPRRSEVFDHRR